MRGLFDQDVGPCLRVIVPSCLLAVLSLLVRVILAASTGRSTVVVGCADLLPTLACGGLIVGLGVHLASRSVCTLGFGISMFATTLMYLPDATQAALHHGRGFAYADASLAAIDRWIAFDWIAYTRWLDAHPVLWASGRYAYVSLPALPFVVVTMLSLSAATERLATYFVAQTACLSMVAAIAVVVPAVGAYDHFGASALSFIHDDFVTAANMTRSIEWLRQASLVGDGVTYQGLISFPSYHAISCVLNAWAMWRTRWARWPMSALSLLILVATPVQGSHYLVDVIAGIVIAAAAIGPSAWLVRALARQPSGLARPLLAPV